ncbi:hypothetical protein DFH07DRAFT_948090 [Mycena maculata]|uniref:Uncharacterized protein n=1 Tax=Mycena maculata TaxID=230809 RepID=A0AAD7KG92_9AGAR|nr:hypothetical protein DFH07DRAFT_948090 [Mycena maculata]
MPARQAASRHFLSPFKSPPMISHLNFGAAQSEFNPPTPPNNPSILLCLAPPTPDGGYPPSAFLNLIHPTKIQITSPSAAASSHISACITFQHIDPRAPSAFQAASSSKETTASSKSRHLRDHFSATLASVSSPHRGPPYRRDNFRFCFVLRADTYANRNVLTPSGFAGRLIKLNSVRASFKNRPRRRVILARKRSGFATSVRR